jgi:hypothetical protein
VPEEDKVVETAEKAAPPPVRKRETPLFERKDFDRFIGAAPGSASAIEQTAPRQAEAAAAAAGSGLALADFPREVSTRPRPLERPLSATNGALASPYEAASIDLRLAVAISVFLGLAGFAGGFVVGRSTVAKPAATKANAGGEVKPDGKAKGGVEEAAAAPAPAPADANVKFKLTGVAQYKDGSEVKPDAGSRVLVFPTNYRAVRRIPIQGLRPGEENVPDQAGVEALTRMGGKIATADAEGNYTIGLTQEGSYWVLILSKNCRRGAPLRLLPEESRLNDYFSDVAGLIGENDYECVTRQTKGDADGGNLRPVKHVFEPAKKAP